AVGHRFFPPFRCSVWLRFLAMIIVSPVTWDRGSHGVPGRHIVTQNQRPRVPTSVSRDGPRSTAHDRPTNDSESRDPMYQGCQGLLRLQRTRANNTGRMVLSSGAQPQWYARL